MIRAHWGVDSVNAGTTTRLGGTSEGVYASLNLGAHVGDAPACVSANRKILLEQAGLPAAPRWLNQVHGNRVIDSRSPEFAHGPPDADAIVSQDGTDVLAILTADCLPIVLCSTQSPGLAAIHCGWRSLAGGIVGATVAALDARPETLRAWLGPAISQPAFEVGDDVRDLFLAGIENAATCFTANENDRWQADLYGLARLYLAAAGVEHVHGGEYCTYRDPARFFSYRRDGQCGRMATFIFRANGVADGGKLD